MTDPLDTLVKETAPIGDDVVGALSLDGEPELLRAILAEPGTAPRRVAAPCPWRRPRIAFAAAAATLAIALALVGVSLTGGGGVQAGPDRAWAAEALRVADAVPRLLLAAPGWRVERADEFSVDTGELTFGDGAATLELRWFPARMHDQLLAGTAVGTRRTEDAEAVGRRAAIFRTPGAAPLSTAIWRMGDHVVEARGGSAGFEELLASLRLATVDEWLSAMPPSVVLPDARAGTVREMLDGIPLPPGFTPPAPGAQGAVRDRYQLGAKVAGAVVCAWIGQWVDARGSGDAAAERQALAAMTGSREWPLLRDMDAAGDYPEVVWELADAMAGRAAVSGGRDGLTVEGTYRSTLGCEGG